VSEAASEAQVMAVENRRFLRRAARHLAVGAGITQFLDIGTGLPTQGDEHQVARDINRPPGWCMSTTTVASRVVCTSSA